MPSQLQRRRRLTRRKGRQLSNGPKPEAQGGPGALTTRQRGAPTVHQREAADATRPPDPRRWDATAAAQRRTRTSQPPTSRGATLGACGKDRTPDGPMRGTCRTLPCEPRRRTRAHRPVNPQPARRRSSGAQGGRCPPHLSSDILSRFFLVPIDVE